MKIEITEEDICWNEPTLQYVADKYYRGDVKKLVSVGAWKYVDAILRAECIMKPAKERKANEHTDQKHGDADTLC